MLNDFNFSAYNIYEIGESISNELSKDGVNIDNKLTIKVNQENFKKIDEDLFYRLNPDKDERGEFIPSDSMIEIKFENLSIVIEKE
jgi:hypothetical protein